MIKNTTYTDLFLSVIIGLTCMTSRAQAVTSISWPVGTENPTSAIESFFGPRLQEGEYDFHRGIDITGSTGDPVLATDDGEVFRLYEEGDEANPYTGGGNVVVLRHYSPLGINFQSEIFHTYYTLYFHLSNISDTLVKGAEVVEGQQIGSLGESGVATHPHLHFEVRIATTCALSSDCNTVGFDPHVNPLRFLEFTENSLPSQVKLTKKKQALRVKVVLPKTEFDLNRIKVTTLNRRNQVLGKKVLDFNRRQGINATSNETIDNNRYDNILILPKAVDSSLSNHFLTVSFRHILKKKVYRIRIRITDTKGNDIYKKTRRLKSL